MLNAQRTWTHKTRLSTSAASRLGPGRVRTVRVYVHVIAHVCTAPGARASSTASAPPAPPAPYRLAYVPMITGHVGDQYINRCPPTFNPCSLALER